VTTHTETLELPFPASDLFDLVADVRRYPEFITWMQTLHVSDVSQGEGYERCRAEARVGFKGFNETFVTDVVAWRHRLAIDVSLVRGPFRKLRNTWRFIPIEGGTRVEFMITFEFRNFVLQTLADVNRVHAVRRVMEAFTQEAKRQSASKMETD